MKTVKVGATFRVLIPGRVREDFGLSPGEKLQVYVQDDTICFRRLTAIESLRGAAKRIRWKADYRDRRDRF